jgi:hypothetical protein
MMMMMLLAAAKRERGCIQPRFHLEHVIQLAQDPRQERKRGSGGEYGASDLLAARYDRPCDHARPRSQRVPIRSRQQQDLRDSKEQPATSRIARHTKLNEEDHRWPRPNNKFFLISMHQNCTSLLTLSELNSTGMNKDSFGRDLPYQHKVNERTAHKRDPPGMWGMPQQKQRVAPMITSVPTNSRQNAAAAIPLAVSSPYLQYQKLPSSSNSQSTWKHGRPTTSDRD